MHNEELHNLYSSTNTITAMASRNIRWVRQVACIGEMRNLYIMLVTKPDGKKPLESPNHIWKNNNKIAINKNWV